MTFTGRNCVVIAIIFFLLMIASCFAHNWYPNDCCRGEEKGGDCRQVDASYIQELPDGCVRYLPTGNLFCGKQVRPSQDEFWHVCIGNRDYNWGRSYCAFIHKRSF